MAREALGIRLLRALLGLLPPSTRETYAAEILELCRRRWQERRGASFAGRGRFWARELAAGAGAVAAAWLDGVRPGGGPHRRGGPGHRHGLRGRARGFGFLQDARFALRGLRRSGAISFMVVATLAVGIGATLTVYALVDAVLLRPIDVPEPERVVRVFTASGRGSLEPTSYPMFSDFRAASSFLEGPAGYVNLEAGFRAGDVTDRVWAGLVSGDYFSLLGVRAYVGRLLSVADTRADAPYVTVLAYDLWRRVFGSDPGVVGASVELGGTTFEVVGVAAPGFRGVTLETATELWVPLPSIREVAVGGLFAAPNILDTRAFPWVSMVGRLRRGATLSRAEAELNRLALGARAELGEDSGFPDDVDRLVRLRPLAEGALVTERSAFLRFTALLGVVVAITLIIACASAAHMVAARGWTRASELGVRRALGASRSRLVRLLLSESVLLALLGGATGLGLALLALRLMRGFSLPGGPPLSRLDLALDPRLVGAALGMSLLCGLLAGLGPAFVHARRSVGERLRSGAPTSSSAGRGIAVLIAGQVALSLVLVVGALLFGRTLSAALDADLGFDPEGVVALSFAFRGHDDGSEEIPTAMARILDGVERSPAVSAAAFAAQVPLSPPRIRLRPVPEGAAEDRPPATVAINVVTPGYFEVLRIPIVAGRIFEGPGSAVDARAAVVSRAAAALLWPREEPLGRRFALLRGLDALTVVGVVEDHRIHEIGGEESPVIYLPATQHNTGMGLASGAHLLARAQRDADDALDVLRGSVRAFDPDLPTWDARRVEAQIDRVLAPQHLGALLLGLLSAVTLTVSAMGVYAMVAFGVRRRTREIGIRIALGAGPARVVHHAVRRTALALALGLALGLGLAFGLTRFLRAYLYGIDPLDAPSFVGGGLVLAAAGAVAAWLPARRAARIQPREAMRPEG